jgi:hypothetical protein
MSDETWIGGRFELGVEVEDGDDDEENPHVVIWMEAKSGAVLALVAVPATEPIEAAAIVLEAAMNEPDQGEPRRPAKVRVESEELGKYLRSRYDDIKIEIAPTPEALTTLEEFYAQMDVAGDDN